MVLSRLLSFLATSDRPDGKAFIDLARTGQTLSNNQFVKVTRRKARLPGCQKRFLSFRGWYGKY